jgi:hypothetical protein
VARPTQRDDARHAVCLLPRWDGLYEHGKPPSDYFARLPRHVAWTCDPSGKNERLELKKAGFNIREGINARAPSALTWSSAGSAPAG